MFYERNTMEGSMLLMQQVLTECGTRCGIDTDRDLKRIASRVEHDGVGFLTTTLPEFCKTFERTLDRGQTSYADWPGWSIYGNLPEFMGGFLELIFDRTSGRLLEDKAYEESLYDLKHESEHYNLTTETLVERHNGLMSKWHDRNDFIVAEAVACIRQVTRLFGKLELEASPEAKDLAYAKFIECENELTTHLLENERYHTESFQDKIEDLERMGRLLYGDVYSDMCTALYEGFPVPKHGPGSTADKLVGNKKFEQIVWPERLERSFPAGEYLIPNWRYYKYLSQIEFVLPEHELPVKVIDVLKTHDTPRLIAMEPTCMQYCQQALSRPLVEHLQRDGILGEMLGFDDQVPNQEMARTGSLTGKLATLDLSEASDRVANRYVEAMMARGGIFADAVQDCRSQRADVRGEVLNLTKFASMGSALTFPIEAMYFLCLIFIGIEKELKRPMTKRTIAGFRGRVRVYGDDLIVPVEYVPSVIASLETYGLKVNAHKSFWTGKFRESCGKEYYNGYDVSLSKARAMLPASRSDVQEIISTVSLRNQFYKAGMWQTVKWLDTEVLEKVIPFPGVDETSPALGKWSFGQPYQVDRLHGDYQSPLVRGMVVVSKKRQSSTDDIWALLKWFLKEGDEPFFDKDHLKYSGRPVDVSIKNRWVSPF
jgi:hypothetical protein